MSQPVAIVTGASRGIGRQTAELLARCGHPVALCSRGDEAARVAAELAAAHGVATFGRAVELTELAQAERFVQEARVALGPVGVLVNNAAVLGPVGPIHGVDQAAWQRALQLDVGVVAAMTAWCLPDMLEAGWGRVINLAGGGVGGPNMAVGVSAYTTAKIAVIGLTEAIGREIDGSGVGICAIAPGTIGTGFMAEALDADAFVGAESLRAMAEVQRDRPDDLAAFSALLHHVLEREPASFNGRTLSARWENPAALDALIGEGPLGPARFRLRRIDEVLYAEQPDHG